MLNEFLEGELDFPLHDTVTGLFGGITKCLSTVVDDLAILVETQLQTIVAATVERSDRVIQEVVAREPERELSAFRASERKALEDRKIAVKEPRTEQLRHDVRALYSRRYIRREARAVDVLVFGQPLARVAGQDRLNGEVGGTKHI